MSSSNVPPYRPACAGYNGPLTIPGGPIYTSQSKATIYDNVTCIPQYLCTPITCSAPIQMQDCSQAEIDNSCATPCGIYPTGVCTGSAVIFPGIATSSYLTNNCYVETTGSVNFMLCRKIGFKNVQAYKVWQGNSGFLDGTPSSPCPNTWPDAPSENCEWQRYTPVSPSVRDLTASVVMTHAVSTVGAPGSVCSNFDTVTQTFAQTVAVDRYTGRIKLSGYTNQSQETIIGPQGCWDQNADCPPFYPPSPCAPPNPTQPCGSFGPDYDTWLVATLGEFGCDTGCWPNYNCSNTGPITNYTSGAAPLGIPSCPIPFAGHLLSSSGLTPYNRDGTMAATVSETSYNYSWIDDNNAAYDTQISDTISVTLSGEYTSDECESDCEGLLGYWNLTDDSQYPWRSDSGISYAPLVTYDEAENTFNPLLSYIGYDSTWIDTRTNTGEVIGKPTPAGYQPFWDATAGSYSYELDEEGNYEWVINGWGAYSPAWCPQATQWTNDQDATGIYGGAYTGIGGNFGFPFAFVGGLDVGLVPIFNNGCFKQKWAEIILFAVPSHNFARPCGDTPFDLYGNSVVVVGDREAINQTTINCTYGTGSYLYPSASCFCNSASNNPGPPYPTTCSDAVSSSVNPWNDTGRKGDYVTRTLIYNPRFEGEYSRMQSLISGWNTSSCGSPPSLPSTPYSASALINILLTQSCAAYSACQPYVVCFSPNTESWARGVTNPMPRISAVIPTGSMDAEYGSFIYQELAQWMVDPLFQNPKSPDCSGTAWVPDNGSCLPCETSDSGTTCYFPIPYEEARCELPEIGTSSAPALPNGLFLGVSSSSPGNWSGPMSYQPETGGGGTPTPWVYWDNQLTYCCNLPEWTPCNA